MRQRLVFIHIHLEHYADVPNWYTLLIKFVLNAGTLQSNSHKDGFFQMSAKSAQLNKVESVDGYKKR